MSTARHDTRIVPALVTAWLTSGLTLALVPAWAGWLAAAGATGLVTAARRRRWTGQAIACLGVATAVLTVVQLRLLERDPITELDGARVTVRAVVAEPLRTAAQGKRYEATVPLRLISLRTDEGTIRGADVTLVALGNVGEVRRGERILLTGQLGQMPATSESAAFLFDAEVLERAPPGGPLARARDEFLEVTDALSPQGRALVPGIAIGDDSRLDDTLEQAMRRAALGHLTAVSGSHVSIVVALLLLGLARFARRVRAVGVVIGIGALVALVGPEPSVVRAAAMGIVAVLSIVLGRPPRPVPALAGGVVFVLVLDPWLSLQYGFALSVAATAAIVLVAPALAQRWTADGGRRRTLALAVAVPTAASLACAPIIVLFSPEVSLVGVLANVLAAPAVLPATLAGLAGVITAPVLPDLALGFARLAELATGWIAGVALTGSRLPAAALPWPSGPLGAVALAALDAALVAWLLHRPQPATHGTRLLPRALLPAAVVLVFLVVLLRPVTPELGRICDVGQGSAAVFPTSPGRGVMVDVGEADSRSQDCLQRAGIHHLDMLVLSHPHADHVGNLGAVLASVPVDRVLVSPAPEPAETVAWVQRELASVGVTPEVSGIGAEGEFAQTRWEVLWPDRASPPPDTNDASLVVAVEVEGVRVLTTGDLGSEGQRGLAGRTQNGDLVADVVIVPHHGSADQDERLVQQLEPDVAVVSVGENDYGHPTAEALELYARTGARVLRTDEEGDVVLRVGGSWDDGAHGNDVGQGEPRTLRAGEGHRVRVRGARDRSAPRPGAGTGPRGGDHAPRRRLLRVGFAPVPREPVIVRRAARHRRRRRRVDERRLPDGHPRLRVRPRARRLDDHPAWRREPRQEAPRRPREGGGGRHL